MNLQDIIQHINAFTHDAENLLSPARSSSLQLEKCLSLDELIYQIEQFRLQAIERASEADANTFLGFLGSIGGLRSELLMWILLKKDSPNKAWDCLISAQMGYHDASRADPGFSHLTERKSLLETMETSLFPPQSFVSAGFVSSRIDCSICLQRYSKCEHLRGKPYMGKFCEVIHRNPVGDHIALVETPADKRCRITSFRTKDGYRDKMSWDVTPSDSNERPLSEESREVKSIMMVLQPYPYLATTLEVLGPELVKQIKNARTSECDIEDGFGTGPE